jgi:hypothetical protein
VNESPGLPFTDLRPGEDAAEVAAAIARVVDAGWFVLGPEVEAFERDSPSASATAPTPLRWHCGRSTSGRVTK